MSTWHVEGARLAAYARGDVDDAEAFSVEAHVVSCAHCQTAVGTLLEPARLDATWADIVDTLDAPRPGFVEALLARAGVAPHVARLLAVTPSLTLSPTTWPRLLIACATLQHGVPKNDGSTVIAPRLQSTAYRPPSPAGSLHPTTSSASLIPRPSLRDCSGALPGSAPRSITAPSFQMAAWSGPPLKGATPATAPCALMAWPMLLRPQHPTSPAVRSVRSPATHATA